MDAERESKSGLCKAWAKSDYCKTFKEVMKMYCPKECKYCSKFISSVFVICACSYVHKGLVKDKLCKEH